MPTGEVIGQKFQSLVAFGIAITHPPQGVRGHLGGVEGGQNNGVIGSQAPAPIHRVGVATLPQNVLFGSPHEEGRTEREHEEAPATSSVVTFQTPETLEPFQ